MLECKALHEPAAHSALKPKQNQRHNWSHTRLRDMDGGREWKQTARNGWHSWTLETGSHAIQLENWVTANAARQLELKSSGKSVCRKWRRVWWGFSKCSQLLLLTKSVAPVP